MYRHPPLPPPAGQALSLKSPPQKLPGFKNSVSVPSRGEKASCCKSSQTGKMDLPILYQIGNTRQKVPAIEGGRGTSHSVFRLQTVVDFITTSLGPGDSGGGNHHPFQLFTQSPPERRGFCGRWGQGRSGKKGIGGQSLPEKWRRGSQAKKGGEGGERHPHTLMTGKGGGAGFNGRIAKKWSRSAFSNLKLCGSIGRLVFMSLFNP